MIGITRLQNIKRVYFTEQQMKDTVNLQLVTGDYVSVYSSAGQCKTPEACVPTDPRLKEATKAQEAARIA